MTEHRFSAESTHSVWDRSFLRFVRHRLTESDANRLALSRVSLLEATLIFELGVPHTPGKR
jgi:hypothetical protein